MIGVINRVSVFFSAHSIRQRKLEEATDQAQAGSAVKKLKDLCHTWWVKRIDAMDRFKKLHSSLVSCFETTLLKDQVVGSRIHSQMQAHFS